MFFNCISLLLMDISAFNIDNVKYLNYMLLGCSSLSNISDIYKLNIKNNKNRDLIFYGCEKLNNIPEKLKLYNKKEIIYYNGEKEEIRIFGKESVENNKENIILLINDNFSELKEFHIDEKKKRNKYYFD